VILEDGVNCGKWHNRYLHGAQEYGLALAVKPRPNSYLMTQKIMMKKGISGILLFDTESGRNFITKKFVRKQKVTGKDYTINISGIGGKNEILKTKVYNVDLTDNGGKKHKVCFHALENIVDEICSMAPTELLKI